MEVQVYNTTKAFSDVLSPPLPGSGHRTMHSLSPKSCFSIGLLLNLLALSLAALQGDECGIHGGDIFDGDNEAENLVSGPGCTMEDGRSECYCASLKDSDPTGIWVWQCNIPGVTLVEFGPVAGKTCPDAIPVPKGKYDSELEYPSCDTDLHPTGLAGDPSCGYDDCSTGGDNTAVCGCVDRARYRIGEGQAWYCLHSTCSSEDGYCGTSNDATPPPPPLSAFAPCVQIFTLLLALVVALAATYPDW
eukprot:gene8807-33677_t